MMFLKGIKSNNGPQLKAFKEIASLLVNRWAVLCFGLLAFQQLIEASATVWLVAMMKKITSGENFFPYLYIYLLSLIAPYIPVCIASIMKISWKQQSQKSFVLAFVKANRNQINEWSNKGIKEQKLSILTAEGPNALQLVVDYIYDLVWYGFCVFFNILALSIVVEPLFAAAYFLSVVTVLVVMKVKRKMQRRLTKKALTARIDLYQSLLAAWDNVLLGNRYNFNLWKDKTNQRLDRCLRKNVELERFDQVLAIVISLVTSIPCLIVVLYHAHSYQQSIETIASFFVTLPVLFTVLSYTYQTLSLVFRWSMHKSKLVAIYKSIQPVKESQSALEKKVKWPKIQMSFSTIAPEDHMSMPGPHALTCYTDILSSTAKCGRLTVRGENGAGKSTLLLLVKNALGDRAFFLPTQNQLSFVAETNKYSTGESLKNRLLEILERVDVDVLLLDEWDANLDSENKERLSSLIDEIAAKKCVIEVRHR